MASSASDQPSPMAVQSTRPPTGSRPGSSHETMSTSPVEMKTLPAKDPAAPLETTPSAPSTQEPLSQAPDAQPSQTQTQTQTTEPLSESITPPAPSKPAPSTELNRTETEAIGPSSDNPAGKPDSSNGPVVIITLLLTTGARHPYKIDEKYLKKRNVNVEAMDPYNISVYTLKELIWRDWREEWEPRPTSPSSIRLIHFGRMLDDKSPLKECRFQTESPNVVHMTVKPQEVVDEEDAKTGKGAGRRDDGEESHVGCRCVIL